MLLCLYCLVQIIVLKSGTELSRSLGKLRRLSLFAVMLQFVVRAVEFRPIEPSVPDEPDRVTVAQKLSVVVDELEDYIEISAELQYPGWKYYYNGGDSYVEGYSEIRQLSYVHYYQLAVRVHCSDPDVLHVILPESLRKIGTLAVKENAKGQFTEMSVVVGDDYLFVVARAELVDNYTAALTISDLPSILSNGILLDLRVSGEFTFSGDRVVPVSLGGLYTP